MVVIRIAYCVYRTQDPGLKTEDQRPKTEDRKRGVNYQGQDKLIAYLVLRENPAIKMTGLNKFEIAASLRSSQ